MGCSYEVFVFWDGRSNVQVNFLMTLSNVGVVLLTLMIGEEVSPWTNSRSGETWAAWPWARFPSVSFTAFFVPSPVSDGLNKLCTNKTSVTVINYQRYHCQALSFSRHCAFVYDRFVYIMPGNVVEICKQTNHHLTWVIVTRLPRITNWNKY